MIPLVFCIDDDKVALLINKISLQKTFFSKEVLTADNGKEAIAYFDQQLLLPESEQKIPDLIFLDLNMPFLDGWEFLEIFEKKFSIYHNKVKIALLSSSINPNDKEKGLANPFVFTFVDKAIGITNLSILKEHPALVHFFNENESCK
ncbi:MAG: response regulator [Bacteroidia bacterium]